MDIFYSIKENRRKKNISSETLLVLTPHFKKEKKIKRAQIKWNNLPPMQRSVDVMVYYYHGYMYMI